MCCKTASNQHKSTTPTLASASSQTHHTTALLLLLLLVVVVVVNAMATSGVKHSAWHPSKHIPCTAAHLYIQGHPLSSWHAQVHVLHPAQACCSQLQSTEAIAAAGACVGE
jgi:hypothetical protein